MRRCILLLLVLLAPTMARAQRFEFIALGDMPYFIPLDHARYDRLIDRINAAKPAFSIHVGDTKAGSTPCSDGIIQRSKEHFDRFAGAVFYTPGDNEWTDCHRMLAGGHDPLERLAFVRKLHFSAPQSLGQKPMTLERQPDVMPNHKLYVENARWTYNKVLFVTVHIPGSNNNFEQRAGAPEEFMARDAANQAWIADSFDKAARESAIAIVFAFQASMWAFYVPKDPNVSGFTRTIESFATRASRFAKPVLLVHGDDHDFLVDHPLRDEKKQVIRNVTRLEVMGAPQVDAVRVTVDPDLPGLFSFTPFLVPENK